MVPSAHQHQRIADRAGKQADGSAKTREATLVTIWTAESRDEQGEPLAVRVFAGNPADPVTVADQSKILQ